jgi:hypothetical protein
VVLLLLANHAADPAVNGVAVAVAFIAKTLWLPEFVLAKAVHALIALLP